MNSTLLAIISEENEVGNIPQAVVSLLINESQTLITDAIHVASGLNLNLNENFTVENFYEEIGNFSRDTFHGHFRMERETMDVRQIFVGY